MNNAKKQASYKAQINRGQEPKERDLLQEAKGPTQKDHRAEPSLRPGHLYGHIRQRKAEAASVQFLGGFRLQGCSSLDFPRHPAAVHLRVVSQLSLRHVHQRQR